MTSLHQLLAEEGFDQRKSLKSRSQSKHREKNRSAESVLLPIHICHDQEGLHSSKHKTDKASTRKGSSEFSSRRASSDMERLKSKSLLRGHEPAIDEIAITAVVSILSGYVGRYIKDETFREMIREKCKSCTLRIRSKESDNGVFANLELGMVSIDKMVEEQGRVNELRMDSLRSSILLMSNVVSLSSKKAKNDSTCGVPNSHLSACAQLYLSIVYKLDKNDRTSARLLLKVFSESPFLARTHLLPDIWEHFFLPHLLHVKIWYQKELEVLVETRYVQKEKRMKALCKVYNDQMDKGTMQFAEYYKEWLKIGAKAPSIPAVPLPSRPSHAPSRRRSSDSYHSHSFINTHLYQTVFGVTPDRRSMELGSRHRASNSMDVWGLEEERVCRQEEYNNCNYTTNKTRRPSNQSYRISRDELLSDTKKRDPFRLFSCQSMLPECVASGNQIVKKKPNMVEETSHLPLNDLSRAIGAICYSDSLPECENAIHVIAKSWLDSHRDHTVETDLSKAPAIEGLLEVIFASSEDEVLEIGISILAELVARNEANRLIVLNSDPQLKIFLKLLKSSSLFLKAAVLLYLSRPKAKQMTSVEWVALVLRVLEFGDQQQTLFSVKCMPQKAAMYLLYQLLAGFNEDGNLENAAQVVSLGGLSLLLWVFEVGDINERTNAAMFLSFCIRADSSSRNYLAENLNKASLLELIIFEIQKKSKGYAFKLLSELLCLSRRTTLVNFLTGLKNGWNGLNIMQVFLVHLQRAAPEDRPLVAAILLQLDLLGDVLKPSVYREEAVDAIIDSLDCEKCSTKIQEQSARALLLLGGCYSYTGDASAEEWLLQQTNLDDTFGASFRRKEILYGNLDEEEEAMEEWQRRVAVILLNSGRKRFLEALSNSIANGIPNLAQSSRFTVAWMSRILHSEVGKDFENTVHSLVGAKGLPESSDYERALNAVIPSFPLKHLIKSSASVTLLADKARSFQASGRIRISDQSSGVYDMMISLPTQFSAKVSYPVPVSI